MTEYDTVCKTQDYQLITSLKQMPVRKIPITFKVEAKIGKPLDIIISETDKSIDVKWSATNRGTYTLEVSKNGGAYSTVKSGIAVGTLLP